MYAVARTCSIPGGLDGRWNACAASADPPTKPHCTRRTRAETVAHRQRLYYYYGPDPAFISRFSAYEFAFTFLYVQVGNRASTLLVKCCVRLVVSIYQTITTESSIISEK
jgi:hypothetical protein